jgi:hypothetical protein
MRPKLKVPLKPAEIILEVVCILAFLSSCVYLIFSWSKMPDIIPIHFAVSGPADNFGTKRALLILLIIYLVIYTILSVEQRFPHKLNYIVKITESNVLIQYTYAVRLLRVLKLLIMLAFSYIEIQIIRSSISGENTLGALFIPLFLVLLLGTLGIYLWKSVKNK